MNLGWGCPPSRLRKSDPLKSHPGATFSRWSAGKPEGSPVWTSPATFYPGWSGGRPQAPVPRETGVPGARELMSAACCAEKNQLGIVEVSTLSSRTWPCRTGPAGPVTARPTPALTAARAPRESWPVPSTPTSTAGARSFLQDKGHRRVDGAVTSGPADTIRVELDRNGTRSRPTVRMGSSEELRKPQNKGLQFRSNPPVRLEYCAQPEGSPPNGRRALDIPGTHRPPTLRRSVDAQRLFHQDH